MHHSWFLPMQEDEVGQWRGFFSKALSLGEKGANTRYKALPHFGPKRAVARISPDLNRKTELYFTMMKSV